MKKYQFISLLLMLLAICVAVINQTGSGKELDLVTRITIMAVLVAGFLVGMIGAIWNKH